MVEIVSLSDAEEAKADHLELDDEWREANPLEAKEGEAAKETLTAKVLAAFEQTGGGVSSEEQEGRWRRYFRSDQDKVDKVAK